jgi:hypothetical protein
MKFPILFVVSIVTSIAIGGCSQSDRAATPTPEEPPASTAPVLASTKPKPKTLVSGTFTEQDHPTKGKVKVVEEQGQKYLEFDRSFLSENGPDLFVILHRSSQPEKYDATNYVNLGRLKNVKGQQRYEIPPTVKVAEFKSATIWCKQFNSTFGVATLK